MDGPTEAPTTDRRVSKTKATGKYMTAASLCEHAGLLVMEAYVGCESRSRARAQWAIEEAVVRLEGASEALADAGEPSLWQQIKNLVRGGR